jgi:O-antigen/teichoic acid export membrane protein
VADATGATISGRRLVWGGSLTALGLALSQVISLGSFVVLARLAPPAIFGVYAASAVLLQTSGLFAGASMQSAIIQRPDRIEEAASTAFAANVVGGLLLAGAAAALGPLIGLFFHSGEAGKAASVLAGTIPITALSIVPGGLLQRRISLASALVQPSASLVYGIAAIVTLATGMGLWGLVLATYAGECARTASLWLLARWRPSPALVSWQMWRSLSAYGRPVVFSLLLREIGFAGSTAVVGRVLGAGELGLFRSAQRFVLGASTTVVYGSAYVLLPAFSRIWQDERRFQASLLRVTRAVTLIVFPMSLAFIPLGRPLATVLLGARWGGAGPIMMAMAGVGVALALDSISSEAFKATGRTEILPRMHGLTAVVPIALMIVLRRFGGEGMGAALSLGMAVVAIYAVGALGRVARVRTRRILAQAGPALMAASMMAAAGFFLERYVIHAGGATGLRGLALLLLDTLAVAALYLASLAALSRRSLVELRELARLLVTRREHSVSPVV